MSLNYESNVLTGNQNNVLTNQNINQNLNKYILDLIKEDSSFINNISSVLEQKQRTEVITKEKITRITFDSKDRNTIPKNILDGKLVYLKNNPLSFTEGKYELLVSHTEKHNLKVNDRIILQNAQIPTYNLKGGIQLIKDDYYIKVNHINHNITKKEVDNNIIKIIIEGVNGNSNNNTTFGNISLASINKIHDVYLISDSDIIGSNDYYYIKIPIVPTSNITDTTSNIKIKFQYIAGIPLNEINSNYPISINQVNGYLTISSIISSYEFKVALNHNALINLKNVGGNKIYYSKIKSYISAYTKPNSYTINLNKTLENVTKIKLISTEFPNTEKIIKIFPENEKNNKLYFQVLEDGNHIYEVQLTSGNYSLGGLQVEIKSGIEELTRINYTGSQIIKISNNATLEKSENFSVITEINQYTDIFSLSLFSIVICIQGISLSTQTYSDSRKRIIVNHYNHGLSAGGSITLAGCIATSSVPATVLNKTHTIESIQDSNHYIIKLPLHNESSSTANTGGGSAINILIPVTFRLLFNYRDTIGEILGFRNVGETNSITSFATTITNNIAYENDYFKDSVGNEIYFNSDTREVENNVIQLFGHNYILMTCNIFKNNESLSTSNIQNLFAKLLLSDAPGSILFNQYIQLSDILKYPIKTLSELEFKFFSPSGSLYEFNGLDHSFTLEFYQEVTDIKGSNINVKSGLASEFNNLNNKSPLDEKKTHIDDYRDV
jgi:hypothetical protein